MAVTVQINADVIKAIKNIQKFQKSSTDSIKKVQKATVGLTARFKRIVEITAGALGARILERGFRALTNTFRNAIDEAVQLENALTGLRAVARATGNDVGALEKTAKSLAADGLIPLTQISASLKNLLSAGFGAEESIKLFKQLRDAAAFNRQGTLALGQAIEGATQGLKNQNSILVDNAGITKNLSVIYKEFAASIGTTVGKLSEQQKRQAIVVGIGREAAIFQGNFNELLETFSGALSSVTTRIQLLLVALGEFITKNDFAIKSVRTFADAITSATEFLSENREALTETAKKGFDLLTRAVRLATVALIVFFSVLAVGKIIAFIRVLKSLAVAFFAAGGAAKFASIALKGLGIGLIIVALDFLITKFFELKKRVW